MRIERRDVDSKTDFKSKPTAATWIPNRSESHRVSRCRYTADKPATTRDKLVVRCAEEITIDRQRASGATGNGRIALFVAFEVRRPRAVTELRR